MLRHFHLSYLYAFQIFCSILLKVLKHVNYKALRSWWLRVDKDLNIIKKIRHFTSHQSISIPLGLMVVSRVKLKL